MAIPKRCISDARHTVRDRGRGQTTASVEDTCSYRGIAVWNGDRGQTVAVLERITPCTAHHVLREGYRSQSITILEYIASHACHSIGNCDRLQRLASREYAVAHACHGIWNYNRG